MRRLILPLVIIVILVGAGVWYWQSNGRGVQLEDFSVEKVLQQAKMPKDETMAVNGTLNLAYTVRATLPNGDVYGEQATIRDMNILFSRSGLYQLVDMYADGKAWYPEGDFVMEDAHMGYVVYENNMFLDYPRQKVWDVVVANSSLRDEMMEPNDADDMRWFYEEMAKVDTANDGAYLHIDMAESRFADFPAAKDSLLGTLLLNGLGTYHPYNYWKKYGFWKKIRTELVQP